MTHAPDTRDTAPHVVDCMRAVAYPDALFAANDPQIAPQYQCAQCGTVYFSEQECDHCPGVLAREIAP